MKTMVSNSMEHDTVPKVNRRVYALECIIKDTKLQRMYADKRKSNI